VIHIASATVLPPARGGTLREDAAILPSLAAAGLLRQAIEHKAALEDLAIEEYN
jgi:hypothetical protein